MKIILGFYAAFTLFLYYSMVTYTPDFLGNVSGIFFALLSGVTLLVAWIIDLKKNKGLLKKNRYFTALFCINLLSMIATLLFALLLGDRAAKAFASSLSNLWGAGMGLVLLTPIIGYALGALGDAFGKKTGPSI